MAENQRKHYRQLYIEVEAGEVYAFIPGTIMDVLVKEGEQVKKGQPLCILHAMKMDNKICSDIDGVVEKINISANQNVSKNDVLIKISKKQEEA
ncbi:MAG: biotin/lipoyl-binding protein [Bacteroidales bacterium]|nr:biotin/lipoyl-binding protein [Bacteroidales bacterium]